MIRGLEFRGLCRSSFRVWIAAVALEQPPCFTSWTVGVTAGTIQSHRKLDLFSLHALLSTRVLAVLGSAWLAARKREHCKTKHK